MRPTPIRSTGSSGAGRRASKRNVLVNFAGARYNVPVPPTGIRGLARVRRLEPLHHVSDDPRFARASAGRPGAIVNMASIHAGGAAPGRSAYAAAKAAVMQLTAVSAVELAPQGIRVNCVAPGFIHTEASAAMIASGALDGAAIERRTPLGRLGDPAEITAVVRFLLSDESRS